MSIVVDNVHEYIINKECSCEVMVMLSVLQSK